MSRSIGLLESVKELQPLLQKHAPSSEDDRRMAPEVMRALVDRDVFRLWIPREYGGLELEPNAAMDIMEEFARADPATGWIVSNCAFISTLVQMLPAHACEKILADPLAVTCGSFTPPGTAREVEGGYLISGVWSFGSAFHYATSVVVLTLLSDDAGLVMGPEGPVSIVAYPERDQLRSDDASWQTLGLRATGSVNFAAESAFVSAERTYKLGPWESPSGAFSGPLYRLGMWLDTLRIARVAIGIAQGALDDFIALATTKTPAYTATLTADRATVQERVARAQAYIEAGRNSMRASVTQAWESVQDGPRITGMAGLSLGLAATFALDAAVQAVDLLYESAGSTAFRDESPLQKRFRDVQTLRQNAFTSWSRYESLGKMILGRTSNWPFHNL